MLIIVLLYVWNYGYSSLTCHCIRTNPDAAIALISSGIGNIDSLTVPSIIGKLFIRMDLDATHTPLEIIMQTMIQGIGKIKKCAFAV